VSAKGKSTWVDAATSDVRTGDTGTPPAYRLVRTGTAWAKDTANGWGEGKDIRFPGGSGLPDSEGLTVGPDAALYITTERDNAASGVPLDSILKFDPAAAGTTLVASDQWLHKRPRLHRRRREPRLRGCDLCARRLADRKRIPHRRGCDLQPGGLSGQDREAAND